jgi:hypothetical protein
MRPIPGDFDRVALPRRDADTLRDILIAERATAEIEVGLACGSSALAIGEALLHATATGVSHFIIDPHRDSSYANIGWDALLEAGLGSTSVLIAEPSLVALARLTTPGGVREGAAFFDGSHSLVV